MIGTFNATARGGRALLNRSPHHSTAAIVAEVEDTRGWKPGEARGEKLGPAEASDGDEFEAAPWQLTPETTFQISDCDRVIRFECDWHTESERANTLHKLDTMIEVLQDFRGAVIEEQRLYVERVEEAKARAVAKPADELAAKRAERNGDPGPVAA